MKIVELIKKFLKRLRYPFWIKPAVEPLKATDDVQNWIVLTYHGQKVNMRITELPLWDAMNRKDKRAMASRFEIMEKKGMVKFQKINGKMVCIRNKDYEARVEKLKREN
jgi:hypothetical protein